MLPYIYIIIIIIKQSDSTGALTLPSYNSHTKLLQESHWMPSSQRMAGLPALSLVPVLL